MPVVLITGASRGIGLEFVRQYAAEGWRVHACARTPETAQALTAVTGDISVHALDMRDVAAIKRLAASIDEPLDVVIANAGVSGGKVGALGEIDYDAFDDLLRVNTLGPIATLEAFSPHLKKAQGKFVAISSGLGSIENASGFAPGYSTSKAALNMAMKSFAATLAEAGVAVAPMHPGWVRTDLGGPAAPVEARDSVAGLRRQIDALKPTPAPRLVTYEGEVLPW